MTRRALGVKLKLRIGTRGSALALAQTRGVAARLETLGNAIELVVIKTSGDKLADVSLAKMGGKGLFIKELEEALARGTIDLAVHSMKDVPAELSPAYTLAAVTARADVRDVLVVAEEARPDDRAQDPVLHQTADWTAGRAGALELLPAGARVGTGSLRRRALIAALRPELTVVPMRGNVDTRLRKLREGQVDALVLAAAGLERLGLSVEAHPLDPEIFLPAPGQGALALEARAGDAQTIPACAPLADPASRAACMAERAFLRALGASCQVPVAAFARVTGERGTRLVLDGLVASLDGREVLRGHVEGSARAAEGLGHELAEQLIGRGARRILEEAERAAEST